MRPRPPRTAASGARWPAAPRTRTTRATPRPRLLQSAATSTDPRRRLDGAKALTGGGGDRDDLSRRLLALSSLIRDMGLLLSRADDRALANADLKPQLQSLLRSFDGDRTIRAFATVDRALSRPGSQRQSEDRRGLAGVEHMSDRLAGIRQLPASSFREREVHARRADGVVPAAGSHDGRRRRASRWSCDTADGPAVGTVTRVPPQVAERRQPAADSPQVVVRRASRDDVVQRLKQAQREQDAQQVAQLKIRERGLPMKLTKVEHVFDGSRLIFYYTSESRVDFRELVRDLAAHFRMRIEMRQIGVRDEAKMLGGYGSCGRPLCCTTWLRSFEPVSIKMAKQQHLSLNPSKLSGQCGRLKCCLRYELPNGEGVKHAGCGDHGGCSNPTGCGNCGTEGGCGSCGHHGS